MWQPGSGSLTQSSVQTTGSSLNAKHCGVCSCLSKKNTSCQGQEEEALHTFVYLSAVNSTFILQVLYMSVIGLFEYIKIGFFCVSQISVNMHSTTYFPKCLWPLKPMPYKSDLFSFKTGGAWVTAFSFKRFCVKNLSLSLGRLMGSCAVSDASKPILFKKQKQKTDVMKIGFSHNVISPA